MGEGVVKNSEKLPTLFIDGPKDVERYFKVMILGRAGPLDFWLGSACDLFFLVPKKIQS